MVMEAFIKPPTRIPFYLKLGIWISEKMTGKRMLPARILAWFPKAAVGSGILEALVAHHDGLLNERLLQLVRMQASYAAACPFCVDMNGHQHLQHNISSDEVLVLRGIKDINDVATFSEREKMAIQYARMVSQTPLKFHPDFMDALKSHYNEREIVILATTAAQVNYWARLIQALGIPPAGFTGLDAE